MDLYAAGCNGWGQLEFEKRNTETGFDLVRFTKIISADKIERPVSKLVYTLAKVDGQYLVAAHTRSEINMAMVPMLATIAISANGDTLVSGPEENILELWNSTAKSGVQEKPIQLKKPVKQMVAYDTGFVILYEDGVVATMGDARFCAPLGRKPSSSTPADEFADVDWPGDIQTDPVKHITASGWAVAALTESGSIYLWGQDPPSLGSKPPTFIPNLGPEIGYTEIDGDKDVADFALGDTHAIALTSDGQLYVAGNNANGQLGHPSIESIRAWTKTQLLLPKGSRITAVAAGPHASFVLVSHEQTE